MSVLARLLISSNIFFIHGPHVEFFCVLSFQRTALLLRYCSPRLRAVYTVTGTNRCRMYFVRHASPSQTRRTTVPTYRVTTDPDAGSFVVVAIQFLRPPGASVLSVSGPRRRDLRRRYLGFCWETRGPAVRHPE